MYTYLVTQPISLFCGEIGLTPEQQKRRKHRPLERIGENLFRINGEVCFKAGEVIELDSRLKVPGLELVETEEKESDGTGEPMEPIEANLNEENEIMASPVNLEDLTKPELQAECDLRNPPIKYTARDSKSDLVAKLKEAEA